MYLCADTFSRYAFPLKDCQWTKCTKRLEEAFSDDCIIARFSCSPLPSLPLRWSSSSSSCPPPPVVRSPLKDLTHYNSTAVVQDNMQPDRTFSNFKATKSNVMDYIKFVNRRFLCSKNVKCSVGSKIWCCFCRPYTLHAWGHTYTL